MKIHAHVTEKLVTNGIKRNSNHCMIADAIHEADPDAKYVSVDLQSISWSNLKKGERYVCLTPTKCQTALIQFDQGVEVAPFWFTAKVVKTDKVGWQAHHPGKSRKGKKYKVTGLHRRKPRRHRKFGLKSYAE